MVIKNKNFSYEQPVMNPNDIYVDCNFSQRDPYTTIGNGTQQFVSCNLLNCDTQGAVVEKSLIIQKDYCYWLNEDMGLPIEIENCRHVVDTDTVTIDSVLVDTIYHREDTLL